jgi:hypothetical protein
MHLSSNLHNKLGRVKHLSSHEINQSAAGKLQYKHIQVKLLKGTLCIWYGANLNNIQENDDCDTNSSSKPKKKQLEFSTALPLTK